MKGKKKYVLITVIVLLLFGGIFYFVQPWIVYRTNPHWTYDLLRQTVESGSYWNEARQRGLAVDAHSDELKTETVFLNKKIQKLENGLYLLQCDGISEWQTWLVLFNRYPLSEEKSKSLVDTIKIKDSDNNINITQKSSSVLIEKLLGTLLYVQLPSPTQIGDTITLEIDGKEIDIEVETVTASDK